MMNEILQSDSDLRTTGRPTPDAAWGLLSESLTGFDWHGGYYAPPRTPVLGSRVAGRGLRGWLRARRAANEIDGMSARERQDARLPVQPRRLVAREPLWERVAAWAAVRNPARPCVHKPC